MMKNTPLDILIVEDDIKLANLIRTYLENHHFSVTHASNGMDGIALAQESPPDLIILDLMMPEKDGLSVCRELRSWYKGRILILTASDDDMEQVASLETGADDYVTKPIHPRVLLARIRVLLRRELPTSNSTNSTSEQITYDNLKLDNKRRRACLHNQPITLTDAEFQLLWLLATHPEQILSRDDITREIRGMEYDGQDRSIDNRIASIRRKLNDSNGLPKRILTIRGKGYLFVADQWQ